MYHTKAGSRLQPAEHLLNEKEKGTRKGKARQA